MSSLIFVVLLLFSPSIFSCEFISQVSLECLEFQYEVKGVKTSKAQAMCKSSCIAKKNEKSCPSTEQDISMNPLEVDAEENTKVPKFTSEKACDLWIAKQDAKKICARSSQKVCDPVAIKIEEDAGLSESSLSPMMPGQF